MSIIKLNKENFSSVTSAKGIVMVDCWAEWCGACKTFNPIYERVAGKYTHHKFAKIDATTEKDLISSLEIENIPALLLYRDGFLLFKQPGYYEEDKLKDIINQAENVDMDEVKAHIEAQNEK
ncbi:MAG: thioredoxin family protein [Ignavibacteria bacterium]|nr:thioredoxin family protein [Ignavibacteria bacterium]MBT8381539.1 thioredoxin family protein [Ignavibacteria bacterium]MBT8390333.1 thioredoxin family protein [Ignavibacteria bacterium]NNJ53919.1 thioredoxin family protein [Ignavibacteriaceae bacterium]NNL22483.1 thioredoxin family protein [Ignavibacteriaceae bacterium]